MTTYKYQSTRDNISFVKNLTKSATKEILKAQIEHSKKESRKRSRGASYMEYHKMTVDLCKEELSSRK